MLERAAANATESCALDKAPADGVGCTKGPHKAGSTNSLIHSLRFVQTPFLDHISNRDQKIAFFL
eukprot:COSAG05_NODE_793_length_7295_cov_2.666481_3_plen_65_part_00